MIDAAIAAITAIAANVAIAAVASIASSFSSSFSSKPLVKERLDAVQEALCAHEFSFLPASTKLHRIPPNCTRHSAKSMLCTWSTAVQCAQKTPQLDIYAPLPLGSLPCVVVIFSDGWLFFYLCTREAQGIYFWQQKTLQYNYLKKKIALKH